MLIRTATPAICPTPPYTSPNIVLGKFQILPRTSTTPDQKPPEPELELDVELPRIEDV